MKSFEVVMMFENHISATDVSYVTRVLRFKCCNVFDALKCAYDHMHYADRDKLDFPVRIDCKEVV